MITILHAPIQFAIVQIAVNCAHSGCHFMGGNMGANFRTKTHVTNNDEAAIGYNGGRCRD